jgi:hypothetical protein
MTTKKRDFPELTKAIKLLGGYEATGRICGVSGKAVQKWESAGRLPRTEATGETSYADAMSKANGEISKWLLIASVMRTDAA